MRGQMWYQSEELESVLIGRQVVWNVLFGNVLLVTYSRYACRCLLTDSDNELDLRFSQRWLYLPGYNAPTFWRTYRLHLQGRVISRAINQLVSRCPEDGDDMFLRNVSRRTTRRYTPEAKTPQITFIQGIKNTFFVFGNSSQLCTLDLGASVNKLNAQRKNMVKVKLSLWLTN
jgi:hypothetical protein